MTDPSHEKSQALAHWVLPTLASAAILAAIGAIGLVAQDAWLVPSLGSAIFVQVMTPKEPSAHWWNSLAGQIIAVPAGFLGVYATGAQAAPEFLSGHPLEPIRLAAVAIAIAATVHAQRGLKATCPAGGAVALLIALGTVPPDLHGAALLGIGILLVTLLGEPARLLILRAL